MPVPIVSYSSVGDGDIYFSSRLYATAWTAASTDTRQQALNDATRMLDRFAWKGFLTDPTQLHAWPRSGVILDCVAVDDSVTPSQILEAQYEIAIALLKGYDPEREVRNAAVTSRGYSSVRVAYDPRLVSDFLRWGIPSQAAWNLILPLLDIDISETVRVHRVS